MADDDPRRTPLHADELRSLLLAPDGPLDHFEVVESTESTNADIVADLEADIAAWPGVGVLVADHQTAGRGREGRTWETPAGTSLTCSFVVRPQVPADRLAWLPLLAGLGAVNAIRATAGVPALLKWPNDLLVPAEDPLEGWGPVRKVGGILAQAVPTPDGVAVVVGIGLNVSQTADELPVPSATSLALAGAQHVDREAMLVALVAALAEIADRWRDADGDAVAAGLAGDVAEVCRTLGTQVRVSLPGGTDLEGVATGLDELGALLVEDAAGQTHRILAGDVHHVRDLG
ncbi:biotin--[acetyl-CoA-carboxylase] ligase [Cellulomonas edaphi]|uniref:biotin--[biotin carboxyl-carrier protein] ligase n=1 Tax=Cellulomonas edaphi TaxID=3053468 RepID=A0ABT7S5H2_9CELL|nr:biotin--[acetyl-CoA-carboxylase] ligase [Cellulomons edaphi]MDM7830861.1 biotin--[acetyl-CoA-carboxylase] ligase [Cellulomons edaphi]